MRLLPIIRLLPMIRLPPYHLVAMETPICLCMCTIWKQNIFVRSVKIWMSFLEFRHAPFVLSIVLACATLSVLDYTLGRPAGLYAAACYERPPLVSFVNLSSSFMPCRCHSETLRLLLVSFLLVSWAPSWSSEIFMQGSARHYDSTPASLQILHLLADFQKEAGKTELCMTHRGRYTWYCSTSGRGSRMVWRWCISACIPFL
jgi:hypothetical protein